MDQTEREAQWATWMRAAIGGDEPAYRRLLESLASRLRITVRHRCRLMGAGDVDVEDIVQETLLAIHLKRHTWRSSEQVSPWVATISRNKLVDVLRRRGRRAELPLDDVDEPEAPQVAEDSSAGHDVTRLLEHLDDRQRSIVRMVSIEGHSSRTAAQALGMTEGALRVALHRSLRSLALLLRNNVE